MRRTKELSDFDGDDMINVRDVIVRVEELRDERDALGQQLDGGARRWRRGSGKDSGYGRRGMGYGKRHGIRRTEIPAG